MTSKERAELARLQKEYNELHERLGYSRDDGTCRAINNRLDAILQEAMIRNFLFLFINIFSTFQKIDQALSPYNRDKTILNSNIRLFLNFLHQRHAIFETDLVSTLSVII